MKSSHRSAPRLEGLTIAHPASLLDEDRPAFSHAVAIARATRSRLVSMHADGGEAERRLIPRAVDVLSAWGMLPGGAPEGDESKLGMRHDRVCHSCCDDPVDTLLDAMKSAEPDLLVATTSAREGAARLFFGSVAEALALHVQAPALLVPVGSRPFVSHRTGAFELRRMLVAIGDAESGAAGVERAVWMAEIGSIGDLDVELLHVGGGGPAPTLTLPDRPGTRFHVRSSEGSPEDAIVAASESSGADVVVMATRGHDSLRDMLTGSHTERVLRRAACPVLSVPLR